MKLSEQEKEELRKFVKENETAIDQNFLAYRRAMAEKESDTEMMDAYVAEKQSRQADT